MIDLKPGDRLVSSKEMRRLTSLPMTTVYELMKAGKFPKNIKISPKRVAWLESELHAYIRSRPVFGDKAA